MDKKLINFFTLILIIILLYIFWKAEIVQKEPKSKYLIYYIVTGLLIILLKLPYENGQKQFETIYKDGNPDGLETYWHENGQKKQVDNWKDGKADGLTTLWYENGQKGEEVNYKDGTLISSKYWNSKGEEVDSMEEAEQ